jgi:hypothetical protein
MSDPPLTREDDPDDRDMFPPPLPRTTPKFPPVPVLSPVIRLIDPPVNAEAPAEIRTEPDGPNSAVPVYRDNLPEETPPTASLVDISIGPLDDCLLLPLRILIKPPVPVLVSPPVKLMEPPLDTLSDPVATPPTKEMSPPYPIDPADFPDPACNSTVPPGVLSAVVSPATMETLPPTPTEPLLVESKMLPLDPLVLEPVTSSILPAFPPTELPEDKMTSPVLPSSRES